MSDLALMEAAREALGFQLTGGQDQALDNVLRDLEGPVPMMCLLQVCVAFHLASVSSLLSYLPSVGTGAVSSDVGAMCMGTRLLERDGRHQGAQSCVQGDVGCGKTAVAFLAIMAAAGSGYQAAMMLPTEILAAQTQAKLQALIQRMPKDLQPRAAILTGSTRARERREVRQLSFLLANTDIPVCRLIPYGVLPFSCARAVRARSVHLPVP